MRKEYNICIFKEFKMEKDTNKSLFKRIFKCNPIKNKLINSIYFKPLKTNYFKSKIVDEESGKCKNISVRTNISKLITKNKKGKLETYIEVESIINDGDKYNYNKTRIKL